MSWKEPYIHVADFVPLAAGSGTSYTPYTIRIGKNAHFEALRTIYQATSDLINIRMINGATGRDIIRPEGDIRAVSSKAFTGITANTFLPYNFPVPYMIPSGTEIVILAADKSGVANNLRFALHGNKIYDGDAPYAKRKNRDHYDFAINSGSMSAYGSVTKTFLLDSSAGFLLAKLTGLSTGTGMILIQDREPWSSRDVHFYNMIGNSQFGNLLTSRKWMPEKTMLSVRFTDLSGTTNQFSVTFHGEKVYT